MTAKPPKPKPINFEIIHENDGPHQPEPYRILAEIRQAHHAEIEDARIALAWRKNYKRDTDGHLILGMCVKASDLQRELVDWDFVILLNRETWMDMDFTPAKKRALIDHELSHAGIALTKDLEPKYDERGRNVWRIRKHDIEEFRDVVERHGCYKQDLVRFADALLKKRETPPLLAAIDKAEGKKKKKESPIPAVIVDPPNGHGKDAPAGAQ